MRAAWAWTMAMLVPTGAAVAETAGAATRDQAEVRSLVDGRLLYRESHYLPQGSAGARWVLYRCPDGKPFALAQGEMDHAHGAGFRAGRWP